MNEKEHLSNKWLEENLYRFPWYKPWFGKKMRKIELRSLGLEAEEALKEADPDE